MTDKYTIDDIMKEIKAQKDAISFPSYSDDNFMQLEQVLTLLVEKVVELTNRIQELENDRD